MNSITIFCLVPRRIKRRVRRAPNPTLPLRLLIWTPGAGGAKGNSLPQHKKCSLLIIYHTLNSLGKKNILRTCTIGLWRKFYKKFKNSGVTRCNISCSKSHSRAEKPAVARSLLLHDKLCGTVQRSLCLQLFEFHRPSRMRTRFYKDGVSLTDMLQC